MPKMRERMKDLDPWKEKVPMPRPPKKRDQHPKKEAAQGRKRPGLK